ncbi:hypothetical protein [Streptomyces sp. NPDC057696]|uniref:hypothetical protein n=1 Tax=Streptomyces sp. NPDC057696 TaxID=3346218 RepID=UPI0036B15F46
MLLQEPKVAVDELQMVVPADYKVLIEVYGGGLPGPGRSPARHVARWAWAARVRDAQVRGSQVPPFLHRARFQRMKLLVALPQPRRRVWNPWPNSGRIGARRPPPRAVLIAFPAAQAVIRDPYAGTRATLSSQGLSEHGQPDMTVRVTDQRSFARNVIAISLAVIA